MLEDSGPAGSVLTDLMTEGAKPSFKEQALLGIACPQGSTWASSRRELEFRSETALLSEQRRVPLVSLV